MVFPLTSSSTRLAAAATERQFVGILDNPLSDRSNLEMDKMVSNLLGPLEKEHNFTDTYKIKTKGQVAVLYFIILHKQKILLRYNQCNIISPKN